MANQPTRRTRWTRRLVPIGAIGLVLTVVAQAQTPQPAAPEQPTGMRRLTQEQYRNAVADVFGEDIQIAGRMDPIMRPPHGLQIMDVSKIAVSRAGGEEYDRMALAI